MWRSEISTQREVVINSNQCDDDFNSKTLVLSRLSKKKNLSFSVKFDKNRQETDRLFIMRKLSRDDFRAKSKKRFNFLRWRNKPKNGQLLDFERISSLKEKKWVWFLSSFHLINLYKICKILTFNFFENFLTFLWKLLNSDTEINLMIYWWQTTVV